MKYALIKNGKVENIIKSSPEHNERIKKDWDEIIEVKTSCSIGFLYQNGEFVDPNPKQEPEVNERELKRIELKKRTREAKNLKELKSILEEIL